MADIQPFCGVHYNQSLIKDLTNVICPPYDIISPQIQKQLYGRSEYNFVRIEFGYQSTQDNETNNRYTRAAAALEDWLGRGILKTDDAPVVYLHDHSFIHEGRKLKRRGIIVRVRLEEWHNRVVRPHEGTLSAPKSDRLNMLWSLQSNTSGILSLYQAPEVYDLLEAKAKTKPLIDIHSDTGEGHAVWAITDSATIDEIHKYLADEPLYIADGHHRYESALNYRRERRACASEPGEKPFDFVMMTLVEFHDPGLVILPAHRLVRSLSKPTLTGLMRGLETFFEIEEVPLSSDVVQEVDSLFARARSDVRLVVFGLAQERLLILKVRDFALTDKLIPAFHSDIYKRLDVSILDHVILEELLGIGREREDAFLGYSHHVSDAVSKVIKNEYQLAFLLSPVKPEVIKAIADIGDRMPRKSSYFYPKLPSGLVFYRFI